MSVLDELAAKLVADGVGVLGTSIFIGSAAVLPGGDGPYITLLETGGIAPGGFRGEGGRTQNQDSIATQHPTVQVVSRAKSYQAARAKAKAAFDSLDGTWNEILSGTYYLKITARQEPTDTGLDDAGRVRITFNVDTDKAPS